MNTAWNGVGLLARFALMLVLQLLYCGAVSCQPDSQKKLEVVILAVSHFDDHNWDNPQLQLSIEKSAHDLEQFFRTRFPRAEIHSLTKSGQTNSTAIRDFLKGDFRHFANGTVTLFFVLSHGVPESSPNPNYNQDLLVVTTDTTKANPELRGLSLSQDLVEAFTHLKASGSIVLAFVDTCYSGEFKNLNMRVSSALAENYGLRMMVMASSLSESQSYRATFSEALIELWNKPSTGNCTTPELAPSDLRKSIGRQLQPQTLGPIEGFPRVVIPYSGKLCLESFAADSGLVVFFNALPNTVAAIIESNGQPIDDPVPLETNLVLPYKAARNTYTLNIVRADGTRQSRHDIDLKQEPVSFEVVGAPQLNQLGAAYLKAAGYIAAAGLSQEETAGYEKRAFASFSASSDDNGADAVAAQLRERGPLDKDWQHAFAIVNDPTKGIGPGETSLELQAKSELGLRGLARVEKLAGRFDRAARYYVQLADLSTGDSRLRYAKQGYFAAGAGANPRFAQQIRNTYELNLRDECPLCLEHEVAAVAEQSDSAKKSLDEFRALCAVHALARLDI